MDPAPAKRLALRALRACGSARVTVTPSRDPEARRAGRRVHGRAPRLALVDVFPGVRSADVRVVGAFDRVDGFSVDAHELLALCAIVSATGSRNVLEIGTFDGGTALNLAANADRVVTLDLPPDFAKDEAALDVPNRHLHVTSPEKVGAKFHGTPLESKIVQAFGDSATVDWQELGGPFDLVFIDGCHHRRYVESDSRNAFRVARPGGVVVWHDYGEVRDVSRVVDRLGVDVKSIVGTRLAVAVVNG